MAPYNDSPGTGTRNGSPAGRGTGAGALAGGALFVGLIALCALVISYNGVFRLAEYGHPRGGPLAHVFPVTYTLLLLMACWTSYLLRDAPPGRRAWVDLVLIPLLVLFAAVVMVLNNLGLIESIPQRVANVIVAVAPLLALLVALLLWMAVRAHLRRKRRAGGPRPVPADDRPTVLRARAVVHEEEPRTAEPDDGFSLEERLLGLGLGPAAPEESALPAEEPEPGPARPVSEPEPAREEPEPVTAEEDEEPEASVPTLPLPRRGSGGGNPIKQAAENPPLAPIAPEPEPAPAPEPVPAGPVDEGFEHDPLPGDPVTDEAEAPAEASAAPEPEEPEPVPAPEPEPVAAPEPVVAEEPEEEVSAETPAFGISWEPPQEDEDSWTRAEYVPPVWTPPEDDRAPEPEEESAPALDHDTGPAVRAAFRIPDDPMAASRSVLSDDLADDGPVWSPPIPEGRDEDRWSAASDDEPLWDASEPAGAPEPVPATDQRPSEETPAADTALEPQDEDAQRSALAADTDDDEPLWPAPTRPGRPGAPATDATDAPAADSGPGHHDEVTRQPDTSTAPAADTDEDGPLRPAPARPSRPDIPTAPAEDTATAPEPADTDDDGPLWPAPTRPGRPGALATDAPEPAQDDRPAEDAPAADTGPEGRNDVPRRTDTPTAPAADTEDTDDGPLWPAPTRPGRTPAAAGDGSSEGAGRARRGGFPAPAVPPGAARPREDDTDDPDEHTTEPLRRREVVEKRPMVLKPPRPPMPDFASGPPSRRVRSEPLRPED